MGISSRGILTDGSECASGRWRRPRLRFLWSNWSNCRDCCLLERWVHPLIAMTAFNLDFLCIHPLRDGNGRVSRLLLLLQCYLLGYEVGRYISLERLIEQNKERYYETLEQSSEGWHEGRHEPWPYVNYLLYILKSAYREFEERVGRNGNPKRSKDRTDPDFCRSILRPLSDFRHSKSMPGGKLRPDPSDAEEPAILGKGRMPGQGAKRRVAKNAQMEIGNIH